jgi:hypothetical protein
LGEMTKATASAASISRTRRVNEIGADK